MASGGDIKNVEKMWKNDDFPIEIDDFPIEIDDFPIEIDDFP